MPSKGNRAQQNDVRPNWLERNYQWVIERKIWRFMAFSPFMRDWWSSQVVVLFTTAPSVCLLGWWLVVRADYFLGDGPRPVRLRACVLQLPTVSGYTSTAVLPLNLFTFIFYFLCLNVPVVRSICSVESRKKGHQDCVIYVFFVWLTEFAGLILTSCRKENMSVCVATAL